MGVTGLWPVLKPAGVKRSLTNLAVVDGFEANPNGMRGLRVGIDASIWMVHATNWVSSATDGRDKGENPELRTILFKCTRLMQKPFLPLFVFDGPYRPDVKRGKNITKTPHWMVAATQEILTALGVEWRMAPGEAEAELAYLNRIGVIDVVLTDDGDTFLFGAKMLMRNCSNTLSANRSAPVLNSAGKDDGNHTMTYHADDIRAKTGLTHGGLILFALLSGGDYHDGIHGCGPEVGVALARCGFGDTLLAAVRQGAAHLDAFLPPWRAELRTELRTNAHGFLRTKKPTLAGRVPESFPDRAVLEMYVHPLTSETKGKDAAHVQARLDWEKEMRVDALAHVCERFFEWGYREAIVKRFRTIVWPYALLRILRRAALLRDRDAAREPLAATVRRHFLSAAASTNSNQDDAEDEDGDSLLVKIHMQRRHPETDDLLEYRLEIAPALLVAFAHAGIKDTRAPPDMTGLSDWSDSDVERDDDGEGKSKAKAKKPPSDPASPLRLWLPATMVRAADPALVEQFEAKEAAKGAKKAKASTGAGRHKAREQEDEERERSTSPAKKTKKTKVKAVALPEEDESADELTVPTQPPKKGKTKAKAKAAPAPFPLSQVEAAPSSSSQEKPKPKGKVDDVFKARKIIRGVPAATASSSKVAEVAKLFAPMAGVDVFRDLTGPAPSSGTSSPFSTGKPSASRVGAETGIRAGRASSTGKGSSRAPSPSKLAAVLPTSLPVPSRTSSQMSSSSFSTSSTLVSRAFSTTPFSSQPSGPPTGSQPSRAGSVAQPSPPKTRAQPKPFPMDMGMDFEVEVDVWRAEPPSGRTKGKEKERATSRRPVDVRAEARGARSSSKAVPLRRGGEWTPGDSDGDDDGDVEVRPWSPPRTRVNTSARDRDKTKEKFKAKGPASVDVICISSDSDGDEEPPRAAVRKHPPQSPQTRSPRKRTPVRVDPRDIIEISD